VRFSHDGRTVASAGDDGGIRVWNVESGARRDIEVGDEPIARLEFTSAGLVSVDAAGMVRATDLADGTSRVLMRQSDAIRALTVSPTGSHLAVAGDARGVSVHDLAKGSTTHSTDLHEWFVVGLAFSPDGAHVASSGADNTVRVWDVRSGEGRTVGELPNTVDSVAYSENGDYLIAGAIEGTTTIWRTSDWNPVRTLEYTASGADVAAAPNGDQLVWSAGADVYALASIDSDPVLLVTAESIVEDLTFSPSGRFMTASTRGGTVHIVDVQTHSQWHLRGHQGGVTSIDYSPDERWVASSSVDGTIRIWPTRRPDSETVWTHPRGVTIKFLNLSPDASKLSIITLDNTLRVLDGDRVIDFPDPVLRTSAAFSPDSEHLAVLTRDGSVVLWDVSDNTMRRHRTHQGDPKLCNGAVCQIRFARDGTSVASAYAGDYIDVWSLVDDTHRRLQASSQVRGLFYSDDSRHLTCGATNGNVTIWDLDDDTRTQGPGRAGLRANARLVPSGEVISRTPTGVIELWNPATGEHRELSNTAASGWGFFFSSDRRQLATGDSDGSITIFDVATWSSRTMPSHSDGVQMIRFLDDEFLLSSAGARTLRMWDIESGENAALHYDDTQLSMYRLSNDGGTIATGDVTGRVRISAVTTPAEPTELRAWLDSVTSAVIEDDRPLSKHHVPPR
jgi:WD40 repeat protein